MRYLRILAIVGAFVILAACGGDSFDEDGFASIEDYSNAIQPAFSRVILDLDAWVNNHEDADAISQLQESNEAMIAVHEDHWDSEFDEMVREDVPGWTVQRSRNDDEWTIDGDELSDVMTSLDSNIEWLWSDIDAMLGTIERDGSVDIDEADFVFDSVAATNADMSRFVEIMWNE
jgi:hypothetical protein